MNLLTEAVILVCLAALVLSSITFTKEKNLTVIDRNTSDALKAFAIFVIMIHHMVLRMSHAKLLLPFRGFGYLGVTIFFFFSGYGLTCQAIRKKNYANGFMVKRILNIYIPAVFASVLYLILLFLFVDHSWNFNIGHILLLYPLDTSSWYIITSFMWYLVFWVCIKISMPWKERCIALFATSILYIIVCFVLHADKNWIDTGIIFPLGVSFAVYQKDIFSYIDRKWKILFPFSFVFMGICMALSFGKDSMTAIVLRSISAVLFALNIILILKFVNFKENAFCHIMGGITLECYLIHGKTIRLVKTIFGDVNSKEILIYIFSTVIFVYLFVVLMKVYKQKICNPVLKIIMKEK